MKKFEVECPICGKYFRILRKHIEKTHKININNFKLLYPNSPLVSKAQRKKMSIAAKKVGAGNWRKGHSPSKETRKKMSEANRGEKNGFYGKKHTKETKKKMSRNHADFNGDKNPLRKWIKNPENAKKYSQIHKDKWDNLKTDPIKYRQIRENHSKAVTKAHISGKLLSYGRGHKSGYFETTDGRKIYYRSSYEKKFLEQCNSRKEVDFRPCNFSIPYMYDGIIKQYIPDFLINGKIIVEIKPAKLVNTEQNKAKIEAATLFCVSKEMIFLVLTESDLQMIGIEL